MNQSQSRQERDGTHTSNLNRDNLIYRIMNLKVIQNFKNYIREENCRDRKSLLPPG